MTSSNADYTEYDRALNAVSRRLQTFDFEAFDKELKLKEILTEQTPKAITHLTDVSFDDIKNIKF